MELLNIFGMKYILYSERVKPSSRLGKSIEDLRE
jgi:hypothetical protein